ncbi:hypothetical protein, conserved [Plasmodium gonderi]|uniref:RRM domain-containing protein n=1 Tax=Plasmodium gonderi TaxID=77519 RepID=A0A1Y1JE97_PLAGO|nr:hypothetical protein, conserved [Plasmodium gonderi]GAW79645.1 hypothetical protein, conserved [Plasmodium gonderi]
MQRREKLHKILRTYYVTNSILLKPKVYPLCHLKGKRDFFINKNSYSIISGLFERSTIYSNDKCSGITKEKKDKEKKENKLTQNQKTILNGSNAHIHESFQLCAKTECDQNYETQTYQGTVYDDNLGGKGNNSLQDQTNIAPNAHTWVLVKDGNLVRMADSMEQSNKKSSNEIVKGEGNEIKKKKKTSQNGKKKKKTEKLKDYHLNEKSGENGTDFKSALTSGEKEKCRSLEKGKKREGTLREKKRIQKAVNRYNDKCANPYDDETKDCLAPVDEKKKKKKKKKKKDDQLGVEISIPKNQTTQGSKFCGYEKATEVNITDNCVNRKFNKDDYFKEFELICKNNNIIIEKLNQVKEIPIFVHKHMSSLEFGNIYAYNNFLYEIYDKFSNEDIKKVKKLMKNYNKLTKKSVKRKIKYFESFYEMCPKEYNHILTCLFIQSIDILKDEDIRNTFYYDQVICNNKENEENDFSEEDFDILERNNDIQRGNDLGLFCVENDNDLDKNYNMDEEKKGEKNNNEYLKQRQFSVNNKTVYELDVHFCEEKETDGTSNTHEFHENNFIIVYNLPIISYDLLKAELRETFSFCGEIKNMEFFNDRLKTVDIKVLNNETFNSKNVGSTKSKKIGTKRMGENKGEKINQGKSIGGKNFNNSLNPNSYTQLYGIIEFFDEKSAARATSEFLRIFGIFCYNKLIYVDKCVNKNIMIITHLPFHLNIYNIFYLLLNASLFKMNIVNNKHERHHISKLCSSKDEKYHKDLQIFENDKTGIKVYKSKEIHGYVGGDSCRIIATDLNGKNDNSDNQVKEEVFYDENEKIKYELGKNKQWKNRDNPNGGDEKHGNDKSRRCEFSLRNSNIKMKSCDSIFSETVSFNHLDTYDYIYEVSRKNFLQFKKKSNIKLETCTNDDDSTTEGKNKNFESFADFYQNQNKIIKRRKLNFNNNGRILILHFDSFKYLYHCLKKFKSIFKNKNCMIFSMNLRRCIYMDGVVKDYVQLKGGKNRSALKKMDTSYTI